MKNLIHVFSKINEINYLVNFFGFDKIYFYYEEDNKSLELMLYKNPNKESSLKQQNFLTVKLEDLLKCSVHLVNGDTINPLYKETYLNNYVHFDTLSITMKYQKELNSFFFEDKVRDKIFDTILSQANSFINDHVNTDNQFRLFQSVQQAPCAVTIAEKGNGFLFDLTLSNEMRNIDRAVLERVVSQIAEDIKNKVSNIPIADSGCVAKK